MIAVDVLAGILLSQDTLHSQWFTVLSAFVALNTVLYLTLAVLKLLPKAYLSDWVTSANRRAESRSIYPDSEEASSASPRDR